MVFLCVGLLAGLAGHVDAARYMENLGRGVVAVRTGTSSVFVNWRLLGTDPAGISFNLYRSTAGGTAAKVNSSVITGGTCYTDTAGDFTKALAYYVKPVINGVEQAASGSFTLTANHETAPRVLVPLGSGNTNIIHFVWVGDLDGDGEYDFVVDRINWSGLSQQVEAYKRDGTFLWSIDLGTNSTDMYNIEPGSSCIDVGHWDGVTVYDLDCDGKAEVIIRTANGVTFGDGAVLSSSNDNYQFISVLDGMTGAERASIQIPADYLSDGPMGAQLGIGYLNGVTPSIVAVMKNRIGSGDFNMMICAWDFKNSTLTQKWKWLRGSQSCSDGHQMRIVDVNGDGKDDICEIGFVVKNDGTLLYTLSSSNVYHGDRWHIGKLDPSRHGLQGYGIQQDNSSGLREYYYDAGTGEILWSYIGDVADLARGDAGDIDPRYSGYECWSFDGVWNGPSGTQITAAGVEPYPVLRLWWDSDELSESYNDGKIEEWTYSSSSTSRLVTTWNYDTYTRSDRGCPMFYGDIFGDWREEVVMTNSDYTKLGIFTTNISTTRRIYTLAHNPEYRNSMTVKGYMQSHQVDFYLGSGMETPPVPDIRLVGESIGDITGDGGVDNDDFVLLAKSWLSTDCTLSPELDLDGDCEVDTDDFAVFTQNWMTADTIAPRAPANPSAFGGNGAVSVDWTGNTEADVVGYNVYRCTTSSGTYTQLNSSLLASLTCTDTAVTNGTTYYYVVTAVDDAANESANSDKISATPTVSAAYWKLDETSGTTTADISGVYNGTLYNMSSSCRVSGYSGNALSFDGTDDYVSASAYYGIGGTSARTVSAWVKTSSTDAQTIVQWGANAAGSLWKIYIASGVVYAITYGGGVYSTGTINNGSWHHIAVVLDEGQTDPANIRIYIDGVEDDNSYTTSTTINTTQDLPVHLGAWYRNGTWIHYLNGLLDDVKIYALALTDTEVANIMR